MFYLFSDILIYTDLIEQDGILLYHRKVGSCHLM